MHQHLLTSHETHQAETSEASSQPPATRSQQPGLHPPPSPAVALPTLPTPGHRADEYSQWSRHDLMGLNQHLNRLRQQHPHAYLPISIHLLDENNIFPSLLPRFLSFQLFCSGCDGQNQNLIAGGSNFMARYCFPLPMSPSNDWKSSNTGGPNLNIKVKTMGAFKYFIKVDSAEQFPLLQRRAVTISSPCRWERQPQVMLEHLYTCPAPRRLLALATKAANLLYCH